MFGFVSRYPVPRARALPALAGAAFVLLVAALPVLGQVADAIVDVQVVDDQNQPLPGATVTITGQETGWERVAVSDAAGMARIVAIPPAVYTVRIQLSGFTPVVQEGLALRVGQTARLVATLKPVATEEITVTAEAPMVDVLKSDVSSNVTPEQIRDLPVAERDFQKLAFIAPGVQRERGAYRFITNAPVLGSGGNASQATVMVDGVDLTDAALGLARTRFSQDAIQEFRVITNRFDTEIGQSSGGALSIITKSGTNEFSGSVFGFYRGDSLRTQGKFETGDQNFTRYQTGFTLGGAAVRDVTHYFLSYEYINEDNIALFRPQGAFVNQAADVDHPFNQHLFLASLDHRIGNEQTLQAKLVLERYREENFRVGGVADEASGMQLNRDNWNLGVGHSWALGGNKLNSLHLQLGRKNFDEPNNSQAMGEYFTFGTTLVTGANIVGDQEMTGDYLELRDTFHVFVSGPTSSHDVKFGGSIQKVEEDWYYPVFPHGAIYWANDTRTLPFYYFYAVGEPRTKVDTTLYGVFVQDDWRVNRNLTASLGLRWDLDTDGNNPDFTHPVEPEKRHTDKNNWQPRFSFVWDVTGRGASVLRGGAGKFTGRYLLVPSFVELQQNGITGRTIYTRINGLFLGLPAAFWMNPADPEHTGVLLKPNIALLAPSLEAPEAVQSSLGFTQKLGSSGLFLDLEAVYVEGDNEIVIRDVNWSGNATHTRPNTNYTQINEYTNEGHSKYKALTASLNGTLSGGHLLTFSLTWADKKNISDDFSPALVDYPSDPADIEAEWGRSRADERLRAVLSGVFHLPWDVIVAPIYEYGSGQPWNARLGYDYNGDGRFSDRAAGVKKYSQDGPDFRSFSLRITKGFAVGGSRLDVIVEGFNLFDNTNFNPDSVDSAMYRSGPTVTNPTASYVANPNFGKYSATLSPREIQLGLRYTF